MDIEQLKVKALNLCTEFLGSAWSEVALNDIEIEQLLSGYGNTTFRCSIKHCSNVDQYEETEYKEVIIRIYGSDLFTSKDEIKFSGESGEAIIIHILAEMGIAPKLLGVFSGGVIMEYIPSRTSTGDDWKDMELCAALARKLAKVHTTFVPISQRPQFLEKVMNMSKSVNKDTIDLSSFSDEKRKQSECILSFPIEEEYKWIQKYIPQISSKVVFSHCDLNSNNIILKHDFNSVDDKIVFIDYEVSTYNYRGFDFAYFLAFKDIKFTRNGNCVDVFYDFNEDESREVIINEYLKEAKKLNPDEYCDKLDTFQHLSMEIDFFDLAHRISMASVSIKLLSESKLDMSMNYFADILFTYEDQKRTFIKKYSNQINFDN